MYAALSVTLLTAGALLYGLFSGASVKSSGLGVVSATECEASTAAGPQGGEKRRREKERGESETAPTSVSRPKPAVTGEAASGSTAVAASAGTHGYYAALASRSDCLAAYSLRNQAQIERYRRTKKRDTAVTYSPDTDTDPRKIDAAKIVLTGNSLATQVWLPVPAKHGKTLLVTWDAWFGEGFAFKNTRIANHKTFQFTSPADEIWTEIRNNWSKGRSGLSAIDGRYYGGSANAGMRGPNVKDHHPLSPQVGQFTIKAETWTRYWAQFEPDPEGWDLYSLWVADEQTEPVRLFDRLQLKLREGKFGVFRLEFNTSTQGVTEGRGPLVSYVRNVVMLQNPTDVPKVLIKPAAADTRR